MLFVIFPNSEIPLTDGDGKAYVGCNGISAQEIRDIRGAVEQFKEDSYKDSNGRLRVNTEIKIIDKPIVRLRDTGAENIGYTLFTQDAYELIKDEVDIDQYDYITVFGNLNLPGNPGYYGLSFSNCSYLPFHQSTGYTIINTQICDFSERTPWRPSLILHEFLHFMEDRCRMLNQVLPFEVDSAKEYLYACEDGSFKHYEQDIGAYKNWEKFYIDVMNQNVILADGTKTGIPDAVWNLTPREFRFSRIDFGSY